MALKSLLKWRKPKQIELEEYLDKLKSRGLAPDGRQVPDPVPLAPPIGYKKQASMVEIVRDMVRSERAQQALRDAGFETLEESDDFDVGDEPEHLVSGYENDLDAPIAEMLDAGRRAVLEREKSPGGVGGPPPTPSPSPAPPEPAAVKPS